MMQARCECAEAAAEGRVHFHWAARARCDCTTCASSRKPPTPLQNGRNTTDVWHPSRISSHEGPRGKPSSHGLSMYRSMSLIGGSGLPSVLCMDMDLSPTILPEPK
eukprot:1063992-Prymnesium_polylepis.2